MPSEDTTSTFERRLHRPLRPKDGAPWAFIVLPKDASAKLPRRGRTSASVVMNGHRFEALLEPDGKKGHWLPITEGDGQKAGVEIGQDVAFEVAPLENELEPKVPEDLAKALAAAPEAYATWANTTTIARIDWIHWITSAKQSKTRVKRIGDACDMLASGKKRVCCFDPSGVYSKAFAAPKADEALG